MNEILFRWAHNTASQSGGLSVVATLCALWLPFMMGVGLLGWGVHRLWAYSNSRLLLATVLSLVLNEVVVGGLKQFVGTARPFEMLPFVTVLIDYPTSQAFPSGHTAAAFVIATLAWLANRRVGACLFILAFLVGWGRVATGVHWPGDILGGAVVGLGVAALVYWLVGLTGAGKRSKRQ